jgi:hypothetical protein
MQTGFALVDSLPPLSELMEAQLCACGFADCQAVKARNAAEEAERARRDRQPVVDFERRRRQRRQSKIEARKSKIEHKKGARPKREAASLITRHSADRGECHRGMPPEREEELMGEEHRTLNIEHRTSNVAADHAAVVGSSQGEFHAAVDVAPAHRRLLDYFMAHFGVYIPLPTLEEVCGHHAVNSRCSELRELIAAELDIDQRNLLYEPTGKVHSHYRICRKEESARLLAKREREQEVLL